MKRITKKMKWGPILTVLFLLCLVGIATADQFVGGAPPQTVQSGTVSGGLYVDASFDEYDPTKGGQVVEKTFAVIPDVNNIQWARLYVAVYCGQMQSNYNGYATISFDGNGDGTYETTLGTEELNVEYVYEYDGGTTPVVVNDHCNRVTSDYLMWYDVTSLISSQTPKSKVATTAVHAQFDGRVKVVTLVIAYNDGDSDEIHYWVNQGHDADTYYVEDWLGETYNGSSSFDLSGMTGTVASATLTVNHMASSDGTYTFRGSSIPSDPSTGNFQGAYFGYNIWDVASTVQAGSSNTLTYDRTDQFYKIPLATLEVVLESGPVVDPPVADFEADMTSGTAPLTVQFTDLSSNTPTSWAWDFYNDGTVDSTLQNPSCTYSTAGTYTVKLTATNEGGSDDEIKSDYIIVTAAASCDLAPTLVNPDTGNVFAKEPNRVRVNIKNNGPQASPATEVRLTSTDGVDVRETVPAIAAGATTAVYVIDPTLRSSEGGSVTYTATVDPDNTVPETNEGNNEKASSAKTVKFNGYKGKRYWDDSDVTTKRVFDLRGGILYSSGDSVYTSGGVGGGSWNDYTVSWASGDLPLPAGSTVEEVRLYVPYTWDNGKTGIAQVPDHFSVTFNGNLLEDTTWYRDESNFGGYDNYYWGLLAYDVTSYFSTGGNSAIIHKDDAGSDLAMYGLTLAVVYDDATATRKQIFMNEEFDILGADATGYATTPEEATAYVPFSGMTITPSEVSSATLITFVPAGNGPEGDLLFNGATLAGNVWDYGSSSGTQVAVDSRDVKTSLLASGNEAGIRSTAGSTPVMAASHAFLVVEYVDAVPVADFTADTTSGEAPLTVQFTDTSAGSITGWEWDFGDGDSTNATHQNPLHTYAAAGTYTVNLTVTGPGGSDSEEKTDYIVVTAAAQPPLAAFTATPLVGVAPLSVTFTDQSTNTPTGWSWEYNSGSGWVEFSTEKNPAYSFTVAGPYDIRLTASNSGGSGVETKTHYIAVATGRQPLVTVQSGTVTGDLYINSPAVYPATETTVTSALPAEAIGNIQWARIFVNTYCGPAGNSYALTSTVKFDGNGDGDYDDEGEILGIETMDIASETNGNSYPLNNHVTRVYSDYEAWYDVTGLISATNPAAYVKGEAVPGKSFDGRIKAVTLVVAYNDPSSTTETRYWVNHGHDWSDPGSGQTTFDTSGIPAGWASAECRIRYTSSSDATTYTFNGNSKSGGVPPGYGGDLNAWDVTADIAAGESNTLVYSKTSGSYKTPLATLKVQYVSAPTAAFSADQTSGDKPLNVQFTDESGGVITGWSWVFGDGGTSTDQNPTHTYTGRGTYDVALTVTAPGGSITETKTGYITVREPAPVIDFTADYTNPAIMQTVTFTATNTGGQVSSWLWDFGDGGTSDQQNPTHQYGAEGTYTVSLTATGPDYTVVETKTNYIQVGAAVLSVTVDPTSIAFGAMQAGFDSTGSTSVTVTTTGGTAWAVTASASNGGYMGTDSATLASPFLLSNDGTNYQAMTSNFENFMSGSGAGTWDQDADVKQAIAAADGPGDYSITLTFTGGFV